MKIEFFKKSKIMEKLNMYFYHHLNLGNKSASSIVNQPASISTQISVHAAHSKMFMTSTDRYK